MRLAAILALTAALPLFAAGHDVSPPTYGDAMQVRAPSGPVSNGKSFLTLWSDDTFGAGLHVYATMADESGVITRTVPFLAYASGVNFQVFQAGDEFVVFTYGAGYDVVASLPSTRIVRLDIATQIVAWNGVDFLAFGNRGAEILDRDGHVLVTGLSIPGPITAGAIGTDFIIGTTTKLIRISSDGTTKNELRIDAPPNTGNAITVVTNGSLTLAVWLASGTELRYALFDGSDAVIRQGTLDGALEQSLHRVFAVWNGAEFIIAIHNGAFFHGYSEYSARIAAIDSSGNVAVAPRTFATSAGTIAATGRAVMALAGSEVLTFPPHQPDAATRQRAFTMLSRQFAPVIVTDGFDFGVLWDDEPGTSMRFGRMTRARVAPDGPGIDLMTVNGLFGNHALAYGGGIYLAVWHHWQQIYAARIDAHGGMLDFAPLIVSSTQPAQKPVVAWNGNQFVVMWQENPQLFRAATVTPDGIVSAPRDVFQLSPYAIPTGGQSLDNVSLTSNGSQLLLTGELRINRNFFPVLPVTVTDSVVGLRLDRDLHAIDTTLVTLVDPVLRSTDMQPRVASNGHDFLVVYRTPNLDVATSVIHTGATLTAEQPVTRFVWGNTVTADVSWSGADYVIALRYNNDGNVGSRGSFVGAMFIDGNGGATKQLRATAAGPSESEWRPSIASAGQESVIAISEAPHPGENVRARAYFASEMPVARPAPGALTQIAASTNGSTTEVEWTSSSENESGFLVSATSRNGRYVSVQLPSSSRSVVLGIVADLVTLIPFNEGGSGPMSKIVPGPRRRTASH